MEKLIQKAISSKASDVFFVTGTKPIMRVFGELKSLGSKDVTEKQIKDFFFPKLENWQKEEYKQNLDLDFRFTLKSNSIRGNMHQQKGHMAISLRIIPVSIPTPKELGLSDTIQSVIDMPHGLFLVTGPAGSGKSTTIASLLEMVNQEKSKHIITIEDPIEFIFENKESIFEQREVKVDTPSFYLALKHILRQNPDIIFVGEMRDPESVAAALTAAETGHLVFSTLHTSTAADTVERIIDMFPHEKQRQILVQLASVLRMVVTQRLLPIKNGRVAAMEVLVNNNAVSNLIRNNKIAQINSVIQTSSRLGMITMNEAIKSLKKKGVVG